MAISKIDWNPPAKLLKQFCLLLVCFSLLVSVWVYYQYANLTACFWIVGISAVISVVGYHFPPFARIVYLAMMIAAWPIGWVVSHLLMAGIFFLVFTPVRVIMVLCGYDPMKRKIDKSAKTYWQPRTRATSSKRYFQQY